MTTLRQAAMQALEALKGADAIDTDMVEAIYSLHEALEQPEQWTGCGECDCAFSCHNGEARCIRLMPEQMTLPTGIRVSQLNRGCGACGIGTDGRVMGYVCTRSDCPTRVTCGGVA
jgi:hypothetical protein